MTERIDHLKHQECQVDPHENQIDPVGLRPDSVLFIGKGGTYGLSCDEEVDLDRFRNELDDDGECEPKICQREP